MMGDFPTTNKVSEYKTFGDILFPTKTVQEAQGMEVLITTTTVEFDKVPEDTFELPKSIRALLKEDESDDG